jgi:ABC-type multidrug transport system fused ATPase/permease subunit
MLAGIARRHRGSLALTYSLTAIENGCEVLYPFVIGLAIDGLLAGQVWRMAPLAAVWIIHLVVGLARHVYDTRVFTRIYAGVAGEMVERQREAGVDPNHVVARVALSREIVTFFETELPAIATVTIRMAGAALMLFLYDLVLGVSAVLALAAILLANVWFARRAYRLNTALNNRLEREVAIVAASPLRNVRRHFERLRVWRVRISDSEAWTWGAIELAMIALTVAALLRLAALPGVSAGLIYAVLAYVFSLYEAVYGLTGIVQSVSRVRDIGRRLAAGE